MGVHLRATWPYPPVSVLSFCFPGSRNRRLFISHILQQITNGAVKVSTQLIERGELNTIRFSLRQPGKRILGESYFQAQAFIGNALASINFALRDQELHASAGFSEGEPEMRFTPTLEPVTKNLQHLLVNSISAGGGVVCGVLSREAQ